MTIKWYIRPATPHEKKTEHQKDGRDGEPDVVVDASERYCCVCYNVRTLFWHCWSDFIETTQAERKKCQR